MVVAGAVTVVLVTGVMVTVGIVDGGTVDVSVAVD
jgi:hypothetical protein